MHIIPKNKVEMYAMQKLGLLGNYLPTWTWREFLDANLEGSYGFRHRTQVGSPLFRRGFDRRGMERYVVGLLRRGKVREPDVLVSQDTALYDDCRQLQGEVSLSDPWFGAGMVLAYSGQLNNQLTCREEVRQPGQRQNTLTGLRAKALLQTYMDDQSYDCLNYLLDTYPDSVIEFTTFSRSVGVLEHNTIFWEVRLY